LTPHTTYPKSRILKLPVTSVINTIMTLVCILK
jgi:hypothetical protein